jgi:3-oxoacyl-(acyl-carrier-protein) synthase III
MNSTIVAVASSLPSRIVTSTELEDQLWEANPTLTQIPGIIEMTTGIKQRYIADDSTYPSTLAARAARKLFTENNIRPQSIDLLIFAAAGQDLIEPATAAIIQHELGLSCPAFDIKNACNSFLNAIEVSAGMIGQGRYRRVLIVTGETPSRSIKYKLQDKTDFKKSFAGYTFGDAGSAVLVEPQEDRGILWQRFITDGQYWNAGTLPGGGARHPRGDEYTYFHGDAGAMIDGFIKIGGQIIQDALSETHTSISDYKYIFVHQPSLPILNMFVANTGLPAEKVVNIVADYGNMAAASLPVALSLKWSALKPGDKCLFVGLAGGISFGVTVLER